MPVFLHTTLLGCMSQSVPLPTDWYMGIFQAFPKTAMLKLTVGNVQFFPVY